MNCSAGQQLSWEEEIECSMFPRNNEGSISSLLTVSSHGKKRKDNFFRSCFQIDVKEFLFSSLYCTGSERYRLDLPSRDILSENSFRFVLDEGSPNMG